MKCAEERSSAVRTIERIGSYALIYEGAVLAIRHVPRLPQPPAVSNFVWMIHRRAARVIVGLGVCGYLLWHFVDGDNCADG